MRTSAFRRDPWSVYSLLRASDPVHFSQSTHGWFLLRYDDVRGALTSGSFSALHPFRASRQAMGPTLVDLEGERHMALKRCLRPFFTREQVTRQHRRNIIDPAIDDLAEALERAPDPDVMRDIAEQLPMRVVLRLLGLPESDAVALSRQLEPIVRYLDSTTAPLEPAATARERLTAYLGTHIEDGVGLASILRILAEQAEIDDTPTRSDVLQLAILLLVAGTETTISAIGNLFVAVLGAPGEWQRLRANVDRRDAVVREALRWQPPLHTTLRFATEAVELNGRCISPGQAVQLSLASANRDEAQFEDPDQFRPERSQKTDLTFGAGRHACLGMILAFEELRAVLDALLARFEHIAPRWTSPPAALGTNFRRPSSLPVALRP